MARTRIFQAGFETGSLHEMDGHFFYAIDSDVVDAVDPQTGVYCMYTKALSLDYSYSWVNISATRQISVGMFQKGAPAFAAKYPNIDIRSAGAALLELRIDNGGLMDLYVGGALKDSMTGLTLGWKHIGIDFYVHASSGWAKVYIDGVEELSFTGNTGSSDIIQLRVGKLTSANLTWDQYWDDIYVDDTTGEGSATAPSPLRFYWLSPNGNGNYADWDGSDGNQVDNYQLVDEKPPSTADYVETNVADEYDSYDVSTLTLALGEYAGAVIPYVYCIRGETTEEIAVGTRLSGVDSIGSDQTLNTAFTHGSYRFNRQVNKPGGGAWAQADIDGVEVVVKSRGSY